MFNFIIVGDVHSSDKNPVSRIDNYFDDTFDLLNQISIISQKVKADAVFFLGDLFHHKAQKENSCNLIRSWVETLKKYPPVFAIAGNHDEIYNNPDLLFQQPLGLLAESGALILLDERFNKSKIFKNDKIKVRFAGYPYDEKLGLEVCNIKKGDEDLLIVLAHIYAAPKREDLCGTPIYGYNEMLNFDADIFAFGHYHKDQGVTKLDNKYFINLGAITRGSLSDEDIYRKPKVAWLQIQDKSNYTIKKIALKIKPADEIFNLSLKKEVEEENKHIEDFIEKLKQEFETSDPIKNINDKISQMNIEKEIKDKVYFYLEQAGLKNNLFKGEEENGELGIEWDGSEEE